MEQLFGLLFFAGILALGFYVAKKNKSDVTRTPKSGGSVTLKGKVDLGPIEAEISCTVTDPSCEKAQVAAAACLKSALRSTAGIIM